MIVLKMLMFIYLVLCVYIGIDSSNRLIDKEKFTRGNVVIYGVFLPGLIFGLFMFFLISFLFILFDFIDDHKEKIYTWWNTPIKK